MQLEHQARWDACTGSRESKTLMIYFLPSRANGPLAMSRLRHKAAVGLLTGHTNLRALGLGEQQDCRLCGDDKEDGIHIVCHCLILMCKR
jgi:hypothetical protein